MSTASKLARIPLAGFLIAAFCAASFAAPGDVCDLLIEADGMGGWAPHCEGSCPPHGCPTPPAPVSGSGVTRWWCTCNGVRGGESVLCQAVLINDSNIPADPWSGRCHTINCHVECVDFPDLPEPGSLEPGETLALCPCGS